MDDQRLEKITGQLVDIVAAAGSVILEVYETNFDVQTKSDESPLTVADLSAHKIIEAGLQELTPDIPIISEESEPPSYAIRSQWQRYWLVDPLDGTKEFVKKNGEFTVNIALINNHKAILGIVYVPVSKKTYIGCDGFGAQIIEADKTKKIIHVSKKTNKLIRIVGSRSHQGDSLKNFLSQIENYELQPMGSSLKFCLIAEGLADVYPRYGPTSEWDTAAAQAVVEQAGGLVLKTDGTPLLYNTKDNILNPDFIVINSPSHKELFLKGD